MRRVWLAALLLAPFSVLFGATPGHAETRCGIEPRLEDLATHADLIFIGTPMSTRKVPERSYVGGGDSRSRILVLASVSISRVDVDRYLRGRAGRSVIVRYANFDRSGPYLVLASRDAEDRLYAVACGTTYVGNTDAATLARLLARIDQRVPLQSTEPLLPQPRGAAPSTPQSATAAGALAAVGLAVLAALACRRTRHA